MRGWRGLLGCTILVSFALSILYAQLFTNARFFCFAMFSKFFTYRISAIVNGTQLSPDQVRERYRIPPSGFQGGSIDQIQWIIEAREQRSADRATVSIFYDYNGRGQYRWNYRD